MSRFVKNQTLIYKPTGQKACVVGTPDEFVLNNELHTRVYAIRFYVLTPEGYTGDKEVIIVPKPVVEEHFRIPDVNDVEPVVQAPVRTFWQRLYDRWINFTSAKVQ